MNKTELAIRIKETNRMHHLWNNNGTWFCHYTLHLGPMKERKRVSMKTSSLEDACRRRDELFARLKMGLAAVASPLAA